MRLSKVFNDFKRFCSEIDGAVSVDWVVLVVILTAMTVLIIDGVQAGVSQAGFTLALDISKATARPGLNTDSPSSAPPSTSGF